MQLCLHQASLVLYIMPYVQVCDLGRVNDLSIRAREKVILKFSRKVARRLNISILLQRSSKKAGYNAKVIMVIRISQPGSKIERQSNGPKSGLRTIE
jgi:hypothetical protein